MRLLKKFTCGTDGILAQPRPYGLRSYAELGHEFYPTQLLAAEAVAVGCASRLVAHVRAKMIDRCAAPLAPNGDYLYVA